MAEAKYPDGRVFRYTYDAKNRLVKIHKTGTNPEIVTGQYFYDGDGNRVKTIVNGKTTYYIGNYYEKIEGQIEGEPSIQRRPLRNITMPAGCGLP
jgi:YD repeat-containing protein